jgi:hypothetical protein
MIKFGYILILLQIADMQESFTHYLQLLSSHIIFYSWDA